MENSSKQSNTSVATITSVTSTNSKMGETEKKRKEIDQLKETLKKKQEDFKSLKTKYAAATSRAATLERELKGSRVGDNSKLRVVIFCPGKQ